MAFNSGPVGVGGYEEFPQEVTFSQTRGKVFGEVEGTE